MEERKALVAMSGGVDSSVAAYLTRQSGYRCVGAIARLCDSSLPGCTDPDGSIADAQAVAQRLGMAFTVLERTEQFRREVVDYFVNTYEQGQTPNPCVRCNNRIKFGELLEQALAMGCSKIVTGHYARIRKDQTTGRYLLYKAADEAKDQSYFLAGLNQHQLSHTLFPLGELTKEEARTIALEQGFVNARKKDSQDVCFIPDGDFAEFLTRYTGKSYPQGNFLDLDGRVVGKHSGAVR